MNVPPNRFGRTKRGDLGVGGPTRYQRMEWDSGSLELVACDDVLMHRASRTRASRVQVRSPSPKSFLSRRSEVAYPCPFLRFQALSPYGQSANS